VPAVHVTPQPPQLLLLFRVTHTPPHSVVPLVQLQAPALHTPLTPHPLPQLPQLDGSAVRSTHAPLHGDVPGGQVHWPALQAAPPVQCFPQAPQLTESSCTFVQDVPHRVDPVGHEVTHALPEQTSVILQVPAQLPPQAAPLSHTHLPLEQCDPWPQATPQPPQLSLSVARSAHLPP
jgi:hypothetical protein